MFTARTIPNAHPGEVFQLFLRRHPIAFLKTIVFFCAETIIGIGAYLLILNTLPALLDDVVMTPILILLGSAYAFLVWLLCFHGFLDYYLDTWIVTNSRIINIEQHGLFSRIRSEQSLSRIQDVSAEVKGLLPTLFGYGTVYVQTAGAEERITMKQVRNPEHIAQILINLVEATKNTNTSTTA